MSYITSCLLGLRPGILDIMAWILIGLVIMLSLGIKKTLVLDLDDVMINGISHLLVVEERILDKGWNMGRITGWLG